MHSDVERETLADKRLAFADGKGKMSTRKQNRKKDLIRAAVARNMTGDKKK